MRIGDLAPQLARRGKDAYATLHVTNGESAGKTLRRSAVRGDVLPWQDVLNEGPVPALAQPELRAVRARFLSECGWGSVNAIRDALAQRDRLLESALRDRRPVVLWFEHDLYDQVQLLQVLANAADLGFDPERVALVNVGSFEGRPDFHGLGELAADELESLWPLRRPVTAELAALGRRSWEALRAPEPGAIEDFLATDSTELPFLASALHRLLEELPDSRNGLSRSERQLLESLADGARTPRRLFVASQEREDAPFDGDAWFWRRLAALGKGVRALVTLEHGAPVPTPPPLGDARTFAAARFALTGDGREVLDGRADRVALLGIDRWLGGTHLHPDHVPRWDRAAGRVVPDLGSQLAP